MNAADEQEPLLYTVPEVLKKLRMSKTQFYDQVRAGRIRIVKQGASTRVTADALNDYVSLLRSESESE
jgi:excisionase family DNA binding protein